MHHLVHKHCVKLEEMSRYILGSTGSGYRGDHAEGKRMDELFKHLARATVALPLMSTAQCMSPRSLATYRMSICSRAMFHSMAMKVRLCRVLKVCR